MEAFLLFLFSYFYIYYDFCLFFGEESQVPPDAEASHGT